MCTCNYMHLRMPLSRELLACLVYARVPTAHVCASAHVCAHDALARARMPICVPALMIPPPPG